jgi:glycosyltransferase involved in cell wall biosynthesis/predicted SAM-dependent methyltransferase
MKKINLGCGPNIINGWENLDVEPGIGGIVCDLRENLPYANSCTSHIYSEHFIEHLSREAALSLLRECYRVLKPGGVIRISTPDLKVIARDYLNNRTDRFHSVGHIPNSNCTFLNESMHNWGHTFLYDFNELEKLFNSAGFYKITRMNWKISSHADLSNRENRPSVSDLIIEATKPEVEERPLVSIVIPSYNHANYIAETINSVLNQTFQDFEICITDDGSTDATINIIESFKDTRIKFVALNKNMGAAFATNHALRRSKGKYISILNSDDIFDNTKIEKQVNFLNANEHIDAVFSHVQFIDENGKNITETEARLGDFEQSNYTRQDWLSKLILFGNCLAHPSILIRHDCYIQIGHYDERYRQLPDYDMWIRLLQKKNIAVIPEKLIKFRKHHDGKNESAPNIETIRRYNWEKICILKKIISFTEDDFMHVCNIAIPEITKDYIYNMPREYIINIIGEKFNNQNLIDCALSLSYEFSPQLGEGGLHQNLKLPSELATANKYRES